MLLEEDNKLCTGVMIGLIYHIKEELTRKNRNFFIKF